LSVIFLYFRFGSLDSSYFSWYLAHCSLHLLVELIDLNGVRGEDLFKDSANGIRIAFEQLLFTVELVDVYLLLRLSEICETSTDVVQAGCRGSGRLHDRGHFAHF